MMDIIRSIINFFGFNDAIVDGIGERGMRDSSIIRYNEVHDMYDKSLYKKERIINLSFLFLTASTLTWIRYIHACSIANTITSA